jgi:hypothetical protein
MNKPRLHRALLRRLAGLIKDRKREARQYATGSESAPLRALTAAALALPGLSPVATQAAPGDEAGFQYGHYTEGQRQLYLGTRSKYNPIQVDTLLGSGNLTLMDRWKFAFHYAQDTWSGATPIATAPLAFGGNHQTVSGASPYLQGKGILRYDRNFNTYRRNETTGDYVKDNRLVHTLSAASPETRMQGDFRLGYEWDESAFNLGGGVSNEPDYYSNFVNTDARWDFNQKLTSLDLGLSYTNSSINAKLDPEASQYFDYSSYAKQIEVIPGPDATPTRIITGLRQDWSTRLGLSQVLNKNAVLAGGMAYTRSTGYLANPYKMVEFIFVDPNQTPEDAGTPGIPPLLVPQVQAVMERRPDERNQFSWDARYVQFIESLDAAVHLDYRFFHDDWGINAHTFEADWVQPVGDGWTVTPRFRYYSQDEADFYQPYWLFKNAEPTFSNGKIDLSKVPVSNYSSDHRLSGYGAISTGISVSKAIGKAIQLQGSFEYYTHAGGLKLGGGGEDSYANFNFYQFNAGIKVDLSAPSLLGDLGMEEHAGHEGHQHGHHAHGAPLPAGVMFGHMMEQPGQTMVGYRFMWSLQDGNILHGTTPVSDATVIDQGCGKQKCSLLPKDMSMYMHMLDIMYAPTDWLNLMLMPQFMAMDMNLRQPPGAPPPPSEGGHNHGGTPHHATGGVGDVGLYALFKLFTLQHHHMHATLGLSAPTGAVDLKLVSGDYEHYGMQLGSGTWDFKPSLTYTGQWDDWSWGGQLSGTHRMESENEVGFAFGDIFQASLWGSYRFMDWLSGSVRGIYTVQGAIDGRYKAPHQIVGPMDMPNSYGGRYWDLGMGLSAVVPSGAFKGNTLSVEWVQPLQDDVNGYQLERDGALNATWSIAF